MLVFCQPHLGAAMKAFLFAATLAVSACASTDYADIKPGNLEGQVVVVWLGGTNGPGDGTFVYVPTANKPLTFTRPDPDANGARIEPLMIYTDGGSIPSIGRVFNGLTPWNYGPAYIVHDWLFRARQCLTDNPGNSQYAFVDEITFKDSAQIIGEAIKTLEVTGRVPKRDISGAIVTAAVHSSISRRLWEAEGACKEVSAEDSKLALSAVNLDPKVGDRSRLRVFREADGKLVSVNPPEVVAVFTFEPNK
jgi:hypothetical protein